VRTGTGRTLFASGLHKRHAVHCPGSLAAQEPRKVDLTFPSHLTASGEVRGATTLRPALVKRTDLSPRPVLGWGGWRPPPLSGQLKTSPAPLRGLANSPSIADCTRQTTAHSGQGATPVSAAGKWNIHAPHTQWDSGAEVVPRTEPHV
jgi:hypothetical protein